MERPFRPAIWFGLVAPVDAGIVNRLEVADRDVDPRVQVATTPASSKMTLFKGLALSLLANTQPAEPAPTNTYSRPPQVILLHVLALVSKKAYTDCIYHKLVFFENETSQ